MLIDSKIAERVFDGTFESTIRALVCTCEEKGWSLVSTKDDVVHIVEQDGRLAKRGYSIMDDGSITWGRAYYLETFPQSDAVGLVSQSLRDIAKSILLSDEPKIGRDALAQMSQYASQYKSVSESMDILSGGKMTGFYEENKAEIRKSCRGNLGEIESKHKVTYFTQMSKNRMKDNLDEIKSVLTTCAKSLDSLECHESGDVFLLLSKFKEQAINASAIIKHSDASVLEMAKSADYFSRSLLTANILKDYAVRNKKENKYASI